MTISAFTSVTSNYLPKARVLAKSFKEHEPDGRFYLVLSDALPSGFDIAREPFDAVITVEELPIEGRNAWIFKHTVVELCTAVKALAALYIIDQYKEQKVIYFDPDMAVFSSLQSLIQALDRNSILLTPHLTEPEKSLNGILDNEMSALRHGVYNLGFFAVKSSDQGMRFLEWWNERLLSFCYDSKHEGLFTDQKWIDLSPGFFDDLKVMRNPEYNVATWNMPSRIATGTIDRGIDINGNPLCFYHFSGFDSGAQEVMLNLYGRHSPVYRDLRNWYIDRCETEGQSELGSIESIYNRYSNGEPVLKEHRLLYRTRDDLQKAFPDPYITEDINNSYYDWLRMNGESEMPGSDTTSELAALRTELATIKSSLSWRVVRKLARFRFLSRFIRI